MRYFIGFLITIGLVILLIILLVSGGGNSNKAKVPTTNKPLISYANSDAIARMTVDGPVNADQSHTQVRITVGRDQVTYEKLTGYSGQVTDSKQFPNSETAYENFLAALAHAGFTKGDTSKSLQDERGYCPLSNRYIFEFNQGSQQIERFWSSDCGKPKTFLGNRGLTTTLFEKQVPGFENFDFGLNL